MTTKNLSTVATDLIGSYGNTAQNVIEAYQAGGERMVTALEHRWNAALHKSRTQLSTDVIKNAANAQAVFSGMYTKGLMQSTQGAEMVVSQLIKLAQSGVERVAANASAFETKTGMTTLNRLAQASKPGAFAMSEFAVWLEGKSAALASKVAAGDAAADTVKRTSASAQRRSAKAA